MKIDANKYHTIQSGFAREAVLCGFDGEDNEIEVYCEDIKIEERIFIVK
jgi:hypothetical protein